MLKKLLVAMGVVLALPTMVNAKNYQTGTASYYADFFNGRLTANGERFNNVYVYTAAHKTLPFGTKVRVTNLKNKRSIVVRINDRGPFVKGRVIDLTRSGAKKLGFEKQGLAKVQLDIVYSPK